MNTCHKITEKEMLEFYNNFEKYYISTKESKKKLTQAEQELILFAKMQNRILDCACGTGEILNIINLEGTAVGIDISSIATRMFRSDNNSSNIDFSTANIYNIPFKDKSFDLVYSVFAIEHFLYPYDALNEMMRVTSKYLIIIAPNLGACPVGESFSSCIINGSKIMIDWIKFRILHKEPNFKMQNPELDMKTWSSDKDAVYIPRPFELLHTIKSPNFMIKKYYTCTDFYEDKPLFKKIGAYFIESLGKLKMLPFTDMNTTIFILCERV